MVLDLCVFRDQLSKSMRKHILSLSINQIMFELRNAGIKVWMCPWMKLSHMGSYIFSGSLHDLAQVGAAATADVSQVKPR